MKLYCVRHGSYDSTTGKLDQNGIEEVKNLQMFFSRLCLPFDSIYSSPKPRAQETANILANGQEIKTVDFLSPTGDPSHVFYTLNQMYGSILIISHNPILQELASLYGQSVIFDTSSCMHLDQNFLRWFVTPKILMRLL